MNDGWTLLLEWLLSHITNWQLAFLEGVATVFWWLARIANGIATFLVSEDLWALLLDTLVTPLETTMPQILNGLVFSPTGVLYIALMLAGILLIIGYGDANFAEPSQVLLWGILVSVLFVSTAPGASGYDLISAFESARRWAANEVITVTAPSGELSDLIAIPMRATSAETNTYTFTLPSQFDDTFFPNATSYDTVTGILIDTWILGAITIDFEIESATSQETRRQAAWDGLLLAALTLAPATLEVMFGVIFATIAAAVLVLILLFIACLPLGFFSFGKEILQSIIRQYLAMWGLTLTSGILIGLLLATESLFLPSNPDVIVLVGYLPILIVVGIAVSFLMTLAWNVMLGTFGLLTATLRATVARDVQNGRLPDGGQIPLSGMYQQALGAAQSIAGLAMLGTTAALTAGRSGVLPALAGGALSRSDAQTGRDAALLARLSSNSSAARTFAATAMTPRTLPAAVGIVAVNQTDAASDDERAGEASGTTQTSRQRRTVANDDRHDRGNHPIGDATNGIDSSVRESERQIDRLPTRRIGRPQPSAADIPAAALPISAPVTTPVAAPVAERPAPDAAASYPAPPAYRQIPSAPEPLPPELEITSPLDIRGQSLRQQFVQRMLAPSHSPTGSPLAQQLPAQSVGQLYDLMKLTATQPQLPHLPPVAERVTAQLRDTPAFANVPAEQHAQLVQDAVGILSKLRAEHLPTASPAASEETPHV